MILKRIIFTISLFTLIYFAYLSVMFFTGTEFPTAAGVVHELVMLPLMGAVPVILVISIVLVIKEKLNFRSLSFYSLLLILASAALLVLMILGYVGEDM